MIINQVDFHAQFGAGRPAIKGSYFDKIVRCDIEVPILTALVDSIKAKRCLEIGVNTGATAAAILAGNKTITQYVGVDLMTIWYDARAAGHFALEDPRFKLIQHPGGAYDIKPGEIKPVDFIFIDADHSYKAVKFDSELARKLINPGGVIAWHDYQHPTCPDVRKYIHEINDQPGQTPIVWVQGTTICYQITAALDAAQTKGIKSHDNDGPAKTKRPGVGKKRSAKTKV